MQLDPSENPPEIQYATVDQDYLGTLDVDIVRGRSFASMDTPESTPVAIVSEAMALRLWGELTVIGERIYLSDDATAPALEIVGVARDTKVSTIGEMPRA